MDYSERLVKLGDELGEECVVGYKLSQSCVYGTGGIADGYFAPDREENLKLLIEGLKSRGIPYFILGRGSNVLVSDEGFRGAVISTVNLKGLSVKGRILTAYSGERVSDAVDCALSNCLGGIEFLSGIPASVGGVVAMNAGCFGKNVEDYIAYVVTTERVYSAKDCGFRYRGSSVKDGRECIVKAAFKLDNVEYEQSESKIEYFRKLRRSKQPKGKTCGSVFKNDGYYAGKVIENCGLKGYRIGGASVSEKHANFIVADDCATSADIRALIRRIKKVVFERVGVALKEEIEYVGCFGDENKF